MIVPEHSGHLMFKGYGGIFSLSYYPNMTISNYHNLVELKHWENMLQESFKHFMVVFQSRVNNLLNCNRNSNFKVAMVVQFIQLLPLVGNCLFNYFTYSLMLVYLNSDIQTLLNINLL